MSAQQHPNVHVPKYLQPHDQKRYADYIVEQTEGRLFVYEDVTTTPLDKRCLNYTRLYYTAKNGQVYMVKGGLHLQPDTLNDLLAQCTEIGVYDPDSEPESLFIDDISLDAFRKRFGIPPIKQPKDLIVLTSDQGNRFQFEKQAQAAKWLGVTKGAIHLGLVRKSKIKGFTVTKEQP